MSLPADEFVERIRLALGAKNANDLADKLGLGAAGGQRVSRWLRGDNEPDYEATMLMLAAAGWLQIEGASAPPIDRLEEVARSVAETLANQEIGLSLLRELRAALLPGAADRQAPPKQKHK